jgi:hypothetical protein
MRMGLGDRFVSAFSQFNTLRSDLPVRLLRSGSALIVLVALINAGALAIAPARADCGIIINSEGNPEFDPTLCPGPLTLNARYVPQLWTAIAITKTTLGNETTWREPSREAAERDAIGLCNRLKKAIDCFVVISAANSCIALAVGQNFVVGLGHQLDYISADHEALSNCNYRGGTNCVVSADPCSDDQPLQ